MNGDESARIVPMPPEMVLPAARLHCAALRGSRTALMGEAYAAAFLGWFASGDHGAFALAAVDRDGSLAGYVVGAPAGYAVDVSRSLVWPAARAVAMRPWLLLAPPLRRGLAARLRVTVTGRTPGAPIDISSTPVVSLVAMAVAPSARRRGVGRALVRAFEAAAECRGAGSVRLWTRCDNAAARAFYERCGWEAVPHSAERMLYIRPLPGR